MRYWLNSGVLVLLLICSAGCSKTNYYETLAIDCPDKQVTGYTCVLVNRDTGQEIELPHVFEAEGSEPITSNLYIDTVAPTESNLMIQFGDDFYVVKSDHTDEMVHYDDAHYGSTSASTKTTNLIFSSSVKESRGKSYYCVAPKSLKGAATSMSAEQVDEFTGKAEQKSLEDLFEAQQESLKKAGESLQM